MKALMLESNSEINVCTRESKESKSLKAPNSIYMINQLIGFQYTYLNFPQYPSQACIL